MGLFSKLKFWKHDEGFGDLGGGLGDMGDTPPGLDDSTGSFRETEELSKLPPGTYPEGDNLTIRGSSAFQRELPPQQPRLHSTTLQGYSSGPDLELVSSKLDTIKAMLESVNQRLETLEREMRKYKGW